MTQLQPPNQRDTAQTSGSEGAAEAVLDVLRGLLSELYPGRSIQLVLDSSLEDDAGLDSLGRTELLRRLEERFGARLPEEKVLGAETVRDLVLAAGTARPRAVPEKAQRPGLGPTPGAGSPEHAGTLIEALHWHAQNHPQQTHIHLLGTDEEVTSIDYADLWHCAMRVAAGLRERALAPGQTVVIMLPTSGEFFYAFAGTLLAGGIPVPIYPPVRMSQIEEHLRRQSKIMENAQATIMITFADAINVGRFLKSRLPHLQEVVTTHELLSSAAGEHVPRQSSDVALLQYTSGSTGTPKGVVLSHANLLANVRAMGQALEVGTHDVFVSWLPLYHDMGLIGAWLGTLYYGVPLVLMSPLAFIARPQRWLWAIHRFGGTLSAAPNFAYDLCTEKIADQDLEGLDLSSLRFTCNGAEPVSAQTLDRFIQRFEPYGFNHRSMAPVYGLAECSVGLTFPPLNRGPRIQYVEKDPFQSQGRLVPTETAKPGRLAMVGCGFVLPGHELRIVDNTGRELPDRYMGRLQFRGPSATGGYYRNPRATAELVQSDGWLESGDFAYVDAGELFITGRQKDLIIRAGRNIYPYDLEQAVGQLPGVRKGGVAVFASIDPAQRTEKLVILAETRERNPDKRRELEEAITGTSLDTVGVAPDDVVLAPPRSVLKTSSGKIRRGACRDIYDQGKIGHRRAVWAQLVHLAATATLPLVKRAWRWLKAYLYAGYAWGVFFAFAIPAWMLIAILPRGRSSRTVVRGAVHTALRLTGIGFHVLGTERVPRDRPCIIVSNHASYLDAMVLGTALPGRFGFVAKRELSRNPFLRIFLQRLGTFYVERFDARQSLDDMDRLLHAVRAGQALVFFPEGTFTRAPGVRPFRMGAFIASAHGRLPVVPTVISGTRGILRGAEWFPRRGRITIKFLDPIEPAGDDWKAAVALRDQARNAILAQTDEPDIAG